MSKNEIIEEIILRYSNRGMTILQKFLPTFFCKEAAEFILNWPKGVIFITTGFYVAGHAETDGPPGALILSQCLNNLGYKPIILTDLYCKNLFEKYNIKTIYIDIELKDEKNFYENLIKNYNPVGMISIERCGVNKNNDYANMKNISIKQNTAKIDYLFSNYYNKINSIGIGDGGNEIGMGNLEKVIENELTLIPCVVKVNKLVIASVSNWGGYGLSAYLYKLSGKKELFENVWDEVKSFIKYIVSLNLVDGVTHENKEKVDGFEINVEKEIIESIAKII